MTPISPINVIKESIKTLPAVKYALGIAGIVAVIAIAKLFVTDLRIAVVGTLVILVLMVGLLVFAKLSKAKDPLFHYPSVIMLWTFLVLTLASAILLFTSVFFAYPLQLINKDKNLPKLEEKFVFWTSERSVEGKTTRVFRHTFNTLEKCLENQKSNDNLRFTLRELGCEDDKNIERIKDKCNSGISKTACLVAKVVDPNFSFPKGVYNDEE